MAGPGYTVSYSPWINPYTGASTAGSAYYTTTSQQPAVRRLTPTTQYSYRYPGVSYGYGESESEDEEGSGMTKVIASNSLLTST
jgi:hypothetical protein